MKLAAWIMTATLLAVIGQVQAQSETRRHDVRLDDAANIALHHVGGGAVSEVAQDTKDGRDIWEVEVVRNGREHEVQIDASDGTVMEVEEKGKISRSKDRRLRDVRISLEEAMDRALAEAGGGTVRKFDLDKERGKTVYEFDIDQAGRMREINVDATSGGVMESEGLFAWWPGSSDRSTEPQRERTYREDIYGYRESPREYRNDGYETRRYYYYYDDNDDWGR